jgi:ribose transport system substrate-binding protein
MMDEKHAFVPVAGESENGFRKLIAAHAKDGLKGLSVGQSPGLVAIAMKAAISALKGNPMPQLISIPIPGADYTTLKDGSNYWSGLTDNFFTTNEFAPCGVNISATEIMAKDEKNSN